MNKLLSSVNIETSESVDINLSPLIDMVFLLLIFFMVTTVFVKESGLNVEKPVAASAEQLENKSIVISINSNGDITHGGESISINDVRGLVQRLLEEQKLPVILKADKVSQTGKVVEVIDECKLAGAENISIATRKKK